MKSLYLKMAEECLPRLLETTVVPDIELCILKQNEQVVLDLKNHYVGYFSFKIAAVDKPLDAPVRLRIRFCETEREITDDFGSYHGTLSASWLKEEIINCDCPATYSLPRRYAARYIVIEVLATRYPCKLSDFCFTAVSSADVSRLQPADIRDEKLRTIDKVAVNTLKNCMHRVFEDGPKRDRRLWLGDLRLEALGNYYTFKNSEIVKRCLYLFAAADPNESGFLPGYVYEYPEYISGSWYLIDYSLLFVAALCDYLEATGDKELFNELYAVAKSVMDAAHRAVGTNGIITVPTDSDVFIDWCEGLCKVPALHGVYLYTLKLWIAALARLGVQSDTYSKRYEKALNAARVQLCEKIDSVHAAVWLILGGALEGEDAYKTLCAAFLDNDTYKPFTPYMHHYLVEALLTISKTDRAVEYIKNYWGGMVDLGADTFYEVYVPHNPDFSPYNDRMINSMCHAWSCTPSYFIRKYFCDL